PQGLRPVQRSTHAGSQGRGGRGAAGRHQVARERSDYNRWSTLARARPGERRIEDMPGGWEWLIILAVALLLFGGSRLAGIGKGVGRSIREFKEEVKTVEGPKATDEHEVVDAEIVQQ